MKLRAHVTEIGTLELECVGEAGRAWKLEWNLRQAVPANAGRRASAEGEGAGA